MRTIDHHGNIICVLENNEMLTECPHGAYAVFEDVGGWLSKYYLVSPYHCTQNSVKPWSTRSMK
ncbi:hypothetical protein DZS_18930 [Dickeya ananatis]